MDFSNISLNDLRDLISIITTGIVGILAIAGYSQWRLQLVGKSKYDIATRLLTTIYKIQNELAFVRSPFVPVEEYPPNKIEGGSPEIYARSQRLAKFSALISEMESRLFEARAILGRAKVEDVENLRRHLQSLFKAFWAYSHLFQDARDDQSIAPLRDEQYKVIVDHDKDDEFRPEVDRLVGKIESDMNSYVK